jgi:hypothetical protein
MTLGNDWEAVSLAFDHIGVSVVLCITGVVFTLCCLLEKCLFLWRRHGAPLPPGPPAEFLIGHYRIVPTDASFKAYAEWGKQYSR